MRNQLQLIIPLACILLFVQCRKDEVITDTTPTPVEENMTNVSFLAHITDESGVAVEQATITIANNIETYQTDENGVVLFNLESIGFAGKQITIEHPDYNNLIKLVTGITDSHNKLEIVLTKPISKIINTGETSSLGDGSLTLPSSLVSSDGSSYTGPVSVRYTYLDPDNINFLDAAPGNLLALNTDNEYQQLASLGMYSIELYDEQNNPLIIPDGSKATISFPVADININTVPDVIPLWYFNEEKALWIEDGKAILDGEMMIAEVSHFTWWNCDIPYDFIPLCMSFIHENGEPATDIQIIFSVDGVQFGMAHTDDNGNILTKTPEGTIFTIAYYIDGELVGTQDIGPYNENSRKPVITLDLNITLVSGRVLDCDMNPIENGYGIILINEVVKIIPIVEGQFSFITAAEGSFDFTLYDIKNGNTTSETITISENGQDIILSDIVVCDGNILSGIRGTVMRDIDGDGIADTPVADQAISIWGDATVEIITNADGTYEVFLPPGTYNLLPSPVFNEETRYGTDTKVDGDTNDGTKGRVLRCIVDTAELDDGNDFFFLPPSTPSISGTVMIDNNGDGIGDTPLTEGRVIFDFAMSVGQVNVPVKPDGSFEFQTLIENTVYDGAISLEISGYNPVSDFDNSPDPDGDDSAEGPNNSIPIRMEYGEMDSDNSFVIQLDNTIGSISGTVMEDTDNDGTGDAPLSGIEIWVTTAGGGPFFVSSQTDENGNYLFDNIPTNTNLTISTQDINYLSISDYDESPDPDGDDRSEGSNGVIPVLVDLGEADNDNNFIMINQELGNISGYVLEDLDNNNTGDIPIEGLGLNLRNGSGTIISSTSSNADGYYEFTDLLPGEYQITAQNESVVHVDFVDVYDGDESPDGDANDGVLNQDDIIDVTLRPNETDSDNNFIERKQ